MIWIISAHLATRESLASLVSSKGYDVHRFSCDQEVRKRIRFAFPLLIIIDCGFSASLDLLGMIRAEQRSRAIPVIMFGDEDPVFTEKAILRGAQVYIVKKSLDWDAIFREIVRFMGRPPNRG